MATSNRLKRENGVKHLDNYPVVIELPVAWGEMDAYRHVNNVVYFRYFENARLEYFRRLDWFEYAVFSVINTVLLKPLTYPDTISVGARVSSFAKDRFTMEHLIVSHAQGVITTEGQGTIVTFHYGSGKKTTLPDDMRRRIEALEAGKR